MATQTVATPRALTTMQPFFRELAVNRETSLALLDGLRDPQLTWRPDAARWSLAEICEHLAVITTAYLPALDGAIRAGQRDGAYSDRPFRASLFGRVLVWTMEPPVRLRQSSPRVLRPVQRAAPQQCVQQYHATQHALERTLERAAGLDLTNVRVTTPLRPQLRLSLGTVIALLLAHERRHLWQATVVRQAADFPA
jgi:hypothetical protein